MNPKHVTLTLIFLLNSKTVDAIALGHLDFISVLLAPTQWLGSAMCLTQVWRMNDWTAIPFWRLNETLLS